MSAHKGKHRCRDPRCQGYDRAAVYKRVKKHGFQIIHVLDASDRWEMFYTVGLFANHQRPEIFLYGEASPRARDADSLTDTGWSYVLHSAAQHVIATPAVDETTTIPADVTKLAQDLYLWKPDARIDAPRHMGIARDYYRDVHVRRLENVPVLILSHKPHESTDAATR